MGTVSIVSALLILLSGIGIFLIACQMMSSNLESASSRRLKQMFAKTSSNKLAGVGIGAAATALIQSSGATTVMTIGFVNAGIITLFQAATIIYGANIGTTITAQIVALGMFGKSTLSTTLIFSALTGIGAFPSHVFRNADFADKAGRNQAFIDAKVVSQFFGGCLMLARPVPHVGLDLLVRHAGEVFEVARHLNGNLGDLRGIVLGVVMHNVL